MKLNLFAAWFKSMLRWDNVVIWIIAFFLIRLIGITNPPLDYSHSWRQVTGTMVARNFVESDANPLYPRVDDNDGGTGIIGMEFPLLNYLVYLVSLVFGYTHWYGRLINLIVSSIGSWYFFLIIRRFINPKLALSATLLLLASMWFSFSRKMMPDTFSFSLAFISLYYGLVYLSSGGWGTLILFAVFFALSTLSKIPAIMFPAFLIVPLLSPEIMLRRKMILSVAGILFFIPALWWYYYWCPHLSHTYGGWYNNGESLIQGFREVVIHPGWAAHHFYYDAMRITGFIAFISGVVLLVKKRDRLLSTILLLSLLLLAVYILKSGHFFLDNDYYMLLYIPVMCLLASYAMSAISSGPLRILALAAIMTEGITGQVPDLRVPVREAYKLTLEKATNSFSNRADLIAISGSPNPQMLYLSHRKGWLVSKDQAQDSSYIKSIAQRGCRFLVIDRREISFDLPYPIIYTDEYFTAYKI